MTIIPVAERLLLVSCLDVLRRITNGLPVMGLIPTTKYIHDYSVTF